MSICIYQVYTYEYKYVFKCLEKIFNLIRVRTLMHIVSVLSSIFLLTVSFVSNELRLM